METLLLIMTGNLDKNSELISTAGRIIRNGGLVAFPTETVYGLGADGLNPEAVKRIYAAKGRPSDNPLILHVDSIEMAETVCFFSEDAHRLAEIFWPGPLTIVLPRKTNVPETISGGLGTVAVRMPSHPVAHALISAAGTPIAAPSANLSGRPSPTCAEHVMDDMKGRIEAVIDDGACLYGVESTMIDMSGAVPILLRPGSITLEELLDLLPEIIIDPSIAGQEEPDPQELKSPGMKYRHYAPQAEMFIVEGTDLEKQMSVIKRLLCKYQQKQKKVVLFLSDQGNAYFTDSQVEVLLLGSRDNLEEIAVEIYSALRHTDDMDIDVIICEGFSETGCGLAVMNRLRKASGYKIIDSDKEDIH